MSKVTKFSDHTTKARLAEEGDITILEAHYAASTALQNMKQRIVDLQAEADKESARKYPNNEYIARCQKKIADLRADIAFCEMQRRK